MRRGWGWYRPSGEETVIALVIMLLINIVALPIMGLAGMCSENPDDKAQGVVMFAIGIIIWVAIIVSMISK